MNSVRLRSLALFHGTMRDFIADFIADAPECGSKLALMPGPLIRVLSACCLKVPDELAPNARSSRQGHPTLLPARWGSFRTCYGIMAISFGQWPRSSSSLFACSICPSLMTGGGKTCLIKHRGFRRGRLIAVLLLSGGATVCKWPRASDRPKRHGGPLPALARRAP